MRLGKHEDLCTKNSECLLGQCVETCSGVKKCIGPILPPTTSSKTIKI